ncbi:hypothetical protein TK78_02820 [Streptomyces sp. Tue 6075]|uniref:hypothetical protein n=1 Tax=Streptomyces sp. Tue 6075 TaxID=1661694 RepID=UPI00094A47DE|nr:hypothetical protein [Streptomyces sp. Tue 6075]APS17986.1 hypothetical protein TK78_02820 [Streptomyces sp. Tue 6075]
MPGQGGNDLFSSEVLADIFSEVSELIARNVVPEISGEDFALAASLAPGRDLNKEEKRRLVALCGLSAEWADDELAFKFTHLAIAEQFLARQIARLPLDQAVSLLFSVPVSPLCARLILSMWKSQGRGQPTELVMELQHKVSAAYASDAHPPGASLSLGALWAKVHGVGEGPRTGRCISVENLELSGSGQVTLVDARVQNLTVQPGIELLLVSGHVERLDLSRSGAGPLLGDSYKHVRELLMHNELAVGRPSITRALGLADEESADDSDNHRCRTVQHAFPGHLRRGTRRLRPLECAGDRDRHAAHLPGGGRCDQAGNWPREDTPCRLRRPAPAASIRR